MGGLFLQREGFSVMSIDIENAFNSRSSWTLFLNISPSDLYPEHCSSYFSSSLLWFTNSGGRRTEPAVEKPLDITCNVWTINQGEPTVSMELKDRNQVEDPVQNCIDKAVSAFRFSIQISDPSTAVKVRK